MKKIIIILSSIICEGNMQAQVLKGGGVPLKGTVITTSNPGVKQLPASPKTKSGKDNSMYNTPDIKTSTDASISGVYSTASIVDGIKVTKTFKLYQNMTMNEAKNPTGVTKVITEESMGKINIYPKEKRKEKGDSLEDCNIENRQVSLRDQGYLTLDIASQITKVLPGKAFRFADYKNGSWKEITEDRNPYRISCSNPNINGLVSEEITDVTQVGMRQAVANIYGRFPTDPAKVAALTFTMYAQEVTNNADLSIRIGAGGYGFGFSADNLLNYKTESFKKTFFVDVVKTLYTIDAEPNPAGLFSNPAIDAKDAIYISSVTYGIRILASIELDIKDVTIMNDFKAKYDGLAYGGYINADVFASDVKNQATVKFYVVGGTSSSVTPAYNISQLQTKVEELARTINYHTCNPIRYTLKNNKNELVTYASATDFFKYRSCDPPGENMKPATVKVKIARIELKNLENDDVDLYGMVWANVVKADTTNLLPKENIYHLMSLRPALYLKSEDIKESKYIAGYGRIVEFNFGIGEVASAILYVYFDLVDQDDSPDDPIEMPNLSKFRLEVQDGSIREYFGIKINLDDILKIEPNGRDIIVDCVDNDGSNPFTITLNIVKQKPQ